MARQQIGDYAIRRELAWGERLVCVATRGQESARYVLVVLEIDDASAIELEDDVLRAMELDHENLMRPVETFADGDLQVVAYDSPPGTTLDQLSHYLADRGEPLGDGAVLEITRQMALGLAAAHAAIDSASGMAAALVHTELGPHQVFITWKGQVKILGFGLDAAFRHAAHGPDSARARAYAAPEIRAGGEPTIAANAYSAGAIAWSLLSRVTPPSDGLAKPLGELRLDLDPTIATAIDAAMRSDPAERETGCEALAIAIDRARVAQPEDLVYCIEIFRALPTTDAAGRPERATTQPSIRSPLLERYATSSAPPPKPDSLQPEVESRAARAPDSKRTGTLRSMEAVTDSISVDGEGSQSEPVRVEILEAPAAEVAPPGEPHDEMGANTRKRRSDAHRATPTLPALEQSASARPPPTAPPAGGPTRAGGVILAGLALLVVCMALLAVMASRSVPTSSPQPPPAHAPH